MHKAQSHILLSLLIIVASAWGYLIYQHWQMTALPMSEMWLPPSEASQWKSVDFFLVYLMWAAMMAAMMLPSAIPMILVFSQVAKRRYRVPPNITFLFASGYLAVWLLFSVGMTLLQWQLHGLQVISPMMETESGLLSAVIFLGAGIYQLTALKSRFLRFCQSPAGFLSNEWREGAKGAFRMGLKHGRACAGCCWAQMLITFAVGVMNLMAMALITLLILVEKVVPSKSLFISRGSGMILMGWGLLRLLVA
jgi:predicted metal-binding membrane protein